MQLSENALNTHQPVSVTRNGIHAAVSGRTATVQRQTKETNVQVSLNLDGTGQCTAQTGIPFLDHMLHQIASHGLLDLDIQAPGDD
ncbi:MAG: imidazoleglycerol-phosphate dehydratase, partial [Cyanobacteria bacterium P01_H01_bin.121]